MAKRHTENRWEETVGPDGEMVRRLRRPWERWHQHGGSGVMPSDRGRASDMVVHYALTSRFRLMLMTHLAAHGRATIPELTLLYGWPRTRLRHKLESLVRSRLVERVMLERPAARDHTRQWRRQPGYTITDEGRRWLWRFGWVSLRMSVLGQDLFLHPVLPDERDRYEPWERPLFWVDDLEPFVRADVPAAPVEALETCLQDVLLRPKKMALIVDLRWYGPMSWKQTAASMRLPTSDVSAMLLDLRKRGWLQRTEGQTGRWFERVSPKWSVTAAGKETVARHVDALRVMMAASSWEPDDSDLAYPFGADGSGYVPHLSFPWEETGE